MGLARGALVEQLRAEIANAPEAKRTAVPLTTALYDEFGEYVRTEWKLLVEKRLLTPDKNPTELAAELGFNPQTIRKWLHDPAYQRLENWLIERRRADLVGIPAKYDATGRFKGETVAARFEEYQFEMQERLLDIIETTKKEELQADLVQKWLGYAGHHPKGAPSGGSGLNLTADQMIVFVQRAREAGLEDPVRIPERALER